MRMHVAIVAAMAVGMAVGGLAVQGLHAQTKKAYSVTEVELLDAAAQAAYVPLVQAAQKAAGGRSLNTGGGKVVSMVGTAPPRVVITEWDSLQKAEAFYNSAAFKDLEPQRNKAAKIIRRYAVETN